ncbi:hypothetical protein ACIGFJ_08155 [Brevundimonas diminuta]|uniref:hypothetical protein n=1 Tax=Brevundimonas TaxID=41275 RepID=UPI000E820F10|nr:hypothetical protein [Brevundimonas sp.]HBY43001.1 hypothetical protein [Brevundimonas sp.]
MTAQHLPLLPPRDINWSKTAFLFGAAVTVAGWVAFGAQAAQRLSALEARTQPLASGDLVRVQADVAWIRARMEEDRRR